MWKAEHTPNPLVVDVEAGEVVRTWLGVDSQEEAVHTFVVGAGRMVGFDKGLSGKQVVVEGKG